MIEIKKIVLTNGLTVLLNESPMNKIAAVCVLYKVGSKDEQPELTGMAHLFEHLMFGGSKNAPDFDIPLQNAGGDNNAFTNTDYTCYYNTVPNQNIDTALWLEADRMRDLVINKNSLSVQRKVVIEEYKEMVLNKPYGDVWHYLSKLCYTVHPYQWPVMGVDMAHIKLVTLKNIRSFYDNYYRPSNAILAISANLSIEVLEKKARYWFDDISSDSIFSTKNQIIEPSQSEFKTLTVSKKNIPSSCFYWAFKMCDRNHIDYYSVDLLSDVLAYGDSSRLFQRLVKDKQLFSTIDAFITGTTETGLFVISGTLYDNIDIDMAKAEVWKILEELTIEEVPAVELDKIRNLILYEMAENNIGCMNKAMSMCYFEYLGDVELINKENEKYQSVTPKQIYQVAKSLFDKNSMTELNYMAIPKNPKIINTKLKLL